MKCPKCQSDMETVSIRANTSPHEIEVDRCNSCKGIWFDEFELSDAKNLEGAESIDIGDSNSGKEQNQNDLIDCPKCNTKMIRMVDAQQSHIWYEHCVTCSGNFFDAGEFKDLKEDTIFDFVKTWLTPERKP